MMHFRIGLSFSLSPAWRPVFLLFFVLCFLDIGASELSCPEKCACSKTTVGASFVNCSNLGLQQIPSQLPQDMTELDLSFNSLGKISPDLFPYMGNLKTLLATHCELKRVILEPDNLQQLENIDLSENSLKGFPSGMPQMLQTVIVNHNLISEITGDSLSQLKRLKELYVEHNEIDVIDEMTFKLVYSKTNEKQKILSSLTKLSLYFNAIKIIADNAFEDLRNLQALNLANNRLKIIGSEMFVGLELLEYLDLSHNRLSSVYSAAFKPLKNLVSLKLHHNKLTEIPERLPMLEWLDVSFNLIRSVSEEHKSEIMAVENFNIGQNPFHCDCHLLWLKDLYDRREFILKHLDIKASDFIPVCSSPTTLVGESWDILSEDVFVCNEDTDLTSVDDIQVSEDFDPKQFEVSLGEVKDEQIQVEWEMKSIRQSFYSVFIHYYKFGEKSKSLQYAEIAANQRQFSLKRLLPETNYVVCIIPKLDEKEDVAHATPLAFHHCLEVTTTRSEVIHVMSYFWILCYYILGMAGTIIFVLTGTGIVALLCGVLLPKADWSAEYVVDEPEKDAKPNGNVGNQNKESDSEEKQQTDAQSPQSEGLVMHDVEKPLTEKKID